MATAVVGSSTVTFSGFGEHAVEFFDELAVDNSKHYWEAHKDIYASDVRAPMEALVGALEKEFGGKVGTGKVFRPYRDVRFAKDKTPYKTNTGMHFRHKAAKDAHAPGFYLHLAPGQVFGGGGMWHPDTKTATKIRQAIVDRPERWREATRQSPFTDRLDIGGDGNMLKRIPTGFDASFEFADDLRRRDYFGWAELSEEEATKPGFLDHYAQVCESAAPLVKFICDALGLEF